MRIGIPDGACERAFSFQRCDGVVTCDDGDRSVCCRNRKKAKARLGKPQAGLYELVKKSFVIV